VPENKQCEFEIYNTIEGSVIPSGEPTCDWSIITYNMIL
jgi:hypothetical protein